MLLSFQGSSEAIAAHLDTTGLWVAGGTLWDYVSRDIIATYSEGAWKHQRCHYRTLTIIGACRFLFGIPRDPSSVSEPIDSVSFVGPTLRVNGRAFAWFQPELDSWRGLARRISWTSFRIISRDAISAFVDSAGIPRLNPWDPVIRYRAMLLRGKETP